jgi:Amt family ammonium transporter
MGEAMLLRFRIDDVVGAIPVHGLCGVWGTLAAGAFYAGDLFNVQRIAVQCLGSAAALLWALPAGYVMFESIDSQVRLRVSTLDEQRGLDYSEHFEAAYSEFTTPQVPVEREAA